MADAIRYCDRCARQIPPIDIKDGSALARDNVAFCNECSRSLSNDSLEAIKVHDTTRSHPKVNAEQQGSGSGRDRKRRPGTGKTQMPRRGSRAGTPIPRRKTTHKGMRAARDSQRAVPIAAVLGGVGGITLGALVVALIVATSRGSEEKSTAPPLVHLHAPTVPANVTPPTDPPPASVQEELTPAAKRLAEIKVLMSPTLAEYRDLVTALRAFPDEFPGTPEAEEADVLLLETEVKHAKIARDRVESAIATARSRVADKKYADAADLLAYTANSLEGSTWYEQEGRKLVEKEVAALEKLRPGGVGAGAAATRVVERLTFENGVANASYIAGNEMDGGAKGGLRPEPTVKFGALPSLKLHADFSKGGAYAGMHVRDKEISDFDEIDVAVRRRNLKHFKVRLRDGEQQYHQSPAIALDQKDGGWQRIVIRDIAKRGKRWTHFGGANDGVWRGPLTDITIMIARIGTVDLTKGETALWIGSVEFRGTPPPDLQSDLVGHWTLDAVDGGRVTDASPAKRDGTVAGSAKLVTGVRGSGMDLDGSDSGFSVPHDVDLDARKDLTVALWVRPDTTSQPDGLKRLIISKRDGWSFHTPYELVMDQNGEIEFTYADVDGPPWASFVFGRLRTGLWTHIAVTRDESGNVVGYVDGVPGKSSKCNRVGAAPEGHLRPLHVGFSNDDLSQHQGYFRDDFMGRVDDVRIYQRALREKEIAELAKKQ